jgi:hypothetical protein
MNYTCNGVSLCPEIALICTGWGKHERIWRVVKPLSGESEKGNEPNGECGGYHNPSL